MTDPAQSSIVRIARDAVVAGRTEAGFRSIAAEVPIAFSFLGTTYAVMMASPEELEDFAIGFCFNEELISDKSDIMALEPIEVDGGIDIQIKLAPARADAFTMRQRRMVGPAGCGLCGVDSIAQALRPVKAVAENGLVFSHQEVARAVPLLEQQQVLNRETKALHAAGFYVPGRGIIEVREDVGRHNALDKLSGALMAADIAGDTGAVVLSSRVSVEMVQKTARLGASLLIAVSAPTALALEIAEQAGICVAAIVRGDEFEIFSHPERLTRKEE